MPKKKTKKWSSQYDKCQGCGTTERKPHGRGLCKACYEREYRRNIKGTISPERSKGGRLPLKIDPKQVEGLASIHCTYEEMSAVLGCNEKTLMRRFGDIIKEGKAKGKMSLRRMQFKSAEAGNISAQIWLGKNILGQKDKTENEITYPQLNEVLENVASIIAKEVKDPLAVQRIVSQFTNGRIGQASAIQN